MEQMLEHTDVPYTANGNHLGRSLQCRYLKGLGRREWLMLGLVVLVVNGISVGSGRWLAFISFSCLMMALLPNYFLMTLAKQFRKTYSIHSLLMITASVAVAFSMLGTWCFYRWTFPEMRLLIDPWQAFLIGVSLNGMWVWPALSVGRALQRREELRKQREERQELERAVLLAELKALQAQVEPHFLFNTLANLMHLIEHDTETAKRLLEHLVAYLRASLPSFRHELTTVEQEAALVHNYLALIAMRFGPRFHYELNVEPQLASFKLPPMMLISLVENAIKHGVERKGGRVKVTVAVQFSRDGVRLSVADNGAGFDGAKPGTGVGLQNIRERLKKLYDDSAQLALHSNEEGGVTAVLSLPRAGVDSR